MASADFANWPWKAGRDWPDRARLSGSRFPRSRAGVCRVRLQALAPTARLPMSVDDSAARGPGAHRLHARLPRLHVPSRILRSMPATSRTRRRAARSRTSQPPVAHDRTVACRAARLWAAWRRPIRPRRRPCSKWSRPGCLSRWTNWSYRIHGAPPARRAGVRPEVSYCAGCARVEPRLPALACRLAAADAQPRGGWHSRHVRRRRRCPAAHDRGPARDCLLPAGCGASANPPPGWRASWPWRKASK